MADKQKIIDDIKAGIKHAVIAHTHDVSKSYVAKLAGEMKRAAAHVVLAETAAPGHTDLMVAPESLDKFMEENPLAVGLEADAAMRRADEENLIITDGEFAAIVEGVAALEEINPGLTEDQILEKVWSFSEQEREQIHYSVVDMGNPPSATAGYFNTSPEVVVRVVQILSAQREAKV